MRLLWLLVQLLALAIFGVALLLAYCWAVLRVTLLGIVEFMVALGD